MCYECGLVFEFPEWIKPYVVCKHHIGKKSENENLLDAVERRMGDELKQKIAVLESKIRLFKRDIILKVARYQTDIDSVNKLYYARFVDKKRKGEER